MTLMKLYARIENGQIAERREFAPGAIPQHKAHLWRPVEGEQPSHDAFRQSISGPVETIEADRVLRTWTVQDIAADALKERVKFEARRRILARYPDWQQVNMTARGVELQDAWRQNGTWTAAEEAEAATMQSAWAWIKAVRAASDAIESMTPIPSDYNASSRWPQ